MAEFLNFFETMPDWQMLVWVLVCLFFAMLLESLIPLFRFDYQKLRHDAFNVGLFVMSGAIVAPIAFALVAIAVWCESNQVGLLYHVEHRKNKLGFQKRR
jgi:hypothetical protein